MTRWNPAEVEMAHQLRREGRTYAAIAKRFPGRSAGAVRNLICDRGRKGPGHNIVADPLYPALAAVIDRHATEWGVSFDHAKVLLANSTVPA